MPSPQTHPGGGRAVRPEYINIRGQRQQHQVVRFTTFVEGPKKLVRGHGGRVKIWKNSQKYDSTRRSEFWRNFPACPTPGVTFRPAKCAIDDGSFIWVLRITPSVTFVSIEIAFRKVYRDPKSASALLPKFAKNQRLSPTPESNLC